MRTLLIFLSVMVMAAACQNNAQDKPAVAGETTAASAPAGFTTMKWLDSVVDMGKITEGQKIEVAFRFKNTGGKPLVIQSVQPSCGCTVADIPKEPIAPGQEGVIKGVFDSANRPGVATKSMEVTANTEGNQKHFLSFTVDVQKKPA